MSRWGVEYILAKVGEGTFMRLAYWEKPRLSSVVWRPNAHSISALGMGNQRVLIASSATPRPKRAHHQHGPPPHQHPARVGLVARERGQLYRREFLKIERGIQARVCVPLFGCLWERFFKHHFDATSQCYAITPYQRFRLT